MLSSSSPPVSPSSSQPAFHQLLKLPKFFPVFGLLSSLFPLHETLFPHVHMAVAPYYPGLNPNIISSQRTFGATHSKGAPPFTCKTLSLNVLHPVLSCLSVMSLPALVDRHFVIQAWLPVDSNIHPWLLLQTHGHPALSGFPAFTHVFSTWRPSLHLSSHFTPSPGWLYQTYKYFLTP